MIGSLTGSLATILGAIGLPVSVVVAAIGLSEHITVSRWFGVILILLAITVGEIKRAWHAMRLKKERLSQK